jgi:hypothetical protein
LLLDWFVSTLPENLRSSSFIFGMIVSKYSTSFYVHYLWGLISGRKENDSCYTQKSLLLVSSWWWSHPLDIHHVNDKNTPPNQVYYNLCHCQP